ncbi:MAG: BamA/TamA family outer membrane protein [Longimicrobiales bacterium]
MKPDHGSAMQSDSPGTSCFVLGAVLALFMASPPASARQAGNGRRGPEIEAVRFIGANSLDRSILMRAIATKPTVCKNPIATLACILGDFDWAEVKQFLADTAQVVVDAERLETLYEAWGFPDARVTGTVVPESDGDVRVEFHVVEGRPLVIRSIDVRGLDRFSPPIRLPSPLPLAPGDPYALPRLESTQQLIRLHAAERGRPYAQIEVSGDVDEPTRTATIVLDVTPGPAVVFGAISVRAERPIGERAVLRQLAYKPGDPFRPSSVERSERRLYDLPVVERAAIEVPGLLRRDTAVASTVIVDARRVHGIDVEGTMSSSKCLELAAFWQHRYFLGGPRLFAIGGGMSNLLAAQTDGNFPCGETGDGDFGKVDYFVRSEIWQPTLFGNPRNALMLSAFVRRESAPNVFIEEGFGGRIAFSRDLGHGLAARLAYSPQRNELDASGIYFCGNYGVCSAQGIADLSGRRWLAPIELAAIWTSAEVPGDVRRIETRAGSEYRPDIVPDWRYGVRTALEGGAGFTGSDYEYGRALIEATVTRAVGASLELAGRARLGGLTGDDVLPPQIRFYSGGVNTVRGVGQNLLGPKVLVVDRDDIPVIICPPTDTSCANFPLIDPDRVTVRPTGGSRVAEANIEWRLWLTNKLQFATFLDFGYLSRDPDGNGNNIFGPSSQSLLTPGIGLRVLTDIGPIRVDLGYDPSGTRVLPILTSDGIGGIVHVGNARFNPYEFGDPGFFEEFWRRLQLHMSIGQAF